MTDPNGSAGRASGPPWIQPEIQQKIRWRNGDIVISVPPKSGTTWTMNIVYQLLAGGTAEFRDIYEEVPWIEFVSHPEQTHAAIVERVNAMPGNRRRAFKTHSAPPEIPFLPGESGCDVKYVVVFRNPEEALVSFHPFLSKHSDEFLDLWQMPPGAMSRPDFPTFYHEVVDANAMQARYFEFLAAWWSLRDRDNVIFLHFSDMKRDHEGTVRRLASFLNVAPIDDRWPVILEYTSFPWMKRHQEKFEARTIAEVPILQSGAMIRTGEAGRARRDGMTDEISRHLHEVGRRICHDAKAVDWFYEGGALP